MSDSTEFVGSVRLFGRLLIQEIDDATLVALKEPHVREALEAVGVPVAAATDLDELAAEYCATLLRPEHTLPPVESLWCEGRYDGNAAADVRAIAAAAAVEVAPGARGTPPDHIGCILLLWAELAAARPDLATRLAQDHLPWAIESLRILAERGEFYRHVALAAADCIVALLADGDADEA